MSKIDFKRELKQLYKPSAKKFAIIEVPAMDFLMVDGQGDPNTATAYKDAIEALYAVSYKIKFTSKKELERDYVVPPLEGLWWAEDMNTFALNKDAWKWTMMIMQPEWISQDMVTQATELAAKKGDLPALEKLRFENYKEGLCVQILYLGSYANEGPVIADMHAYAEEEGYQLSGKHHEIYLSDPRKVAPEKLKTIIRQPISLA